MYRLTCWVGCHPMNDTDHNFGQDPVLDMLICQRTCEIYYPKSAQRFYLEPTMPHAGVIEGLATNRDTPPPWRASTLTIDLLPISSCQNHIIARTIPFIFLRMQTHDGRAPFHSATSRSSLLHYASINVGSREASRVVQSASRTYASLSRSNQVS